MRVLWFTNVPFPESGTEFGNVESGSGGWLWGLGKALLYHTDITLGVASACLDGKDMKVFINGIYHYRIAVKSKSFSRVTLLQPDQDFIRSYKAVVSDFNPDLIHIHGTEQTYGLLTAEGHLNKPTVISLQGVISGIYPHVFGGMNISELMHCHGLINILFRHGIFFDKILMHRRCLTEKQILKGNKYYIGRTLWDRAQLRGANPHAVYHHCDEVLRSEFYSDHSTIIRFNHPTVMATWGSSPIRGTHVLLRAIELVRREVPDVELRLARGNFKRSKWFKGYWTYLDGLIKDLGIADSVTFLPGLNEKKMASELSHAHVFVQASLIENSSNTLCEAMLLGIPSIVSFAGGMPSLVKDEESALCFPPGDHRVLAEQLIRMLLDQKLAERIASNAKEVALNRHDPEGIALKTLAIYNKVVDGCVE